VNTEYLTDTIVLLAAAVIAVPLFQSLGLGAIPGFLVAGIVLGPSGLGFIENYDEIGHLAELGVVLLLFVIGIEINPSRLWKMKGLVLGLGSLQVFITGGLITIIVHETLQSSWKISLLIGSALALSSTAFVLQLLTERKMLSSEYGRPAVAVLLLQDLAVVPLLALVSLMATPELTIAEDVFFAFTEALLILVLIITTARYILNPTLNRLARFSSPEIFTASALLLVLGSAKPLDCRFILSAPDYRRDPALPWFVAGAVFYVHGHVLKSHYLFCEPSSSLRYCGCFNCWEVPHSLAFVTCVWHTEHDIGFDSFTPGSKW
jgi:Kef-type K+ transport system membrane component KefB